MKKYKIEFFAGDEGDLAAEDFVKENKRLRVRVGRL